MKKRVTILTFIMVFMIVMQIIVLSAGAEIPVTLDILGHPVHEKITKGAGGDLIPKFLKNHPEVISYNFITFEIAPLQDRLLREFSLPSTDIEVAYLLNVWALPRVASLLMPLNSFLEEKPIEGFEENFSSGMLDTLTFDGQLYGIPVRSATMVLGYNKELFAMAGLDREPRTPEEFWEFAAQATFKRPDGAQVYGLANAVPYFYTSLVQLARMYDGDFITTDLEVVCNEPPMVKTVEMYSKMFQEGILPPDQFVIGTAEKFAMIQQGILAMAFDSASRIESYNKPGENLYPSWEVVDAPLAPELRDKYEGGTPNSTEFWSLVIPRNTENPELAWEYIRFLSSAESALAMAINGNTPSRASVYLEDRFKEVLASADVMYRASLYPRVALPAFDESPKAMDLIDSYIQRAMLKEMTAQAAMDELAVKLRELSSQLR